MGNFMVSNMASLLTSICKQPCFRSLVAHYHGHKTMKTLLFFTIHRRLSFQMKTHGFIHVQSSRMIVMSSSRNKQDSSKRELRQQSVLLVDETGTNLSETSLGKAVESAPENPLDHVLTNKQNKTSVPLHKTMRKIEQRALKTRRARNIEVSDRIEPRDLSFKLKQVQKWLEKGHEVKVRVKSRGKIREEKWKILKKVEQELEEIGVPVGRPKEESPLQITCVFKPRMESDAV